ncbi:solute carrier organic anion transporter family member 74D isoform X1 [Vespula pensylvanica]|uniref:solute carrier organic anion transporter family member 74D isoform X1 n=1 Tax=Vespula pensylvanica TaxID=30213 RepID=UPI001CBA2FBE|nr:solute carrier organic anion transporter family member 74D isoform X1 [Vespula pensylvanica]XP_043667162.1 solute carrier organic anion transporter family member 74D isoform X1 [Vespula pensylvanica]XP_043667164.1 solute carrier organic anion transporter family member 74D isoform X1 [Vespula pensylvanica]XP_043667165.1 solute carrier organic anion transporter family member 74D isoform X1 [Vespula pensylvanica]XP_043667166.1 solute carrier organic anion transporter family member 74D isoform X
MAGEDTQILANGTVEALTIIPAKMANGNGLICSKHNNNGSIPNGKLNDIGAAENGKLIVPDEKSSSLHTEFDDADVSCGWGPLRPHWLQYFATKQAFLATFCITWVLQGMYYTYFVSVITTIEKLFQIQSKTTGIIMSATEIGQIGSSLLLTYYGGQGHRPKWIAWGMILFAVSSFTCSMPHFIFGEQLIQQNEMLFSGVGPAGESNGPNNTDPVPANLCKLHERPENNTLDEWILGTTAPHGDSIEYCEGDFLTEQRIQSKITTVVLAIFFVSLLGVGMGQTAVYTLGIPYIDDNVTSKESPLYFAITIGVRILGPALGFILGSLCTMLYADLSVNPQITPTDPRWVGAWWLGLVLISAMLVLVSIGMFAFPTRLPMSRTPPKRADAKKPSLRDFPKAVKRLLKNDILMFRTASSVLHILPIAGLYTFLPKYLESQFRLPAHHANMISGVGGILVMGLGIIISGVFILRAKPNARFVAAWIAFTAVVYAIGMGVLMFIGCPMDDFAGLVSHSDGISSFEPTCEASCDCDRNKFSPICGADGKTYFSACHAGCSNYTIADGKVASFYNCQCIGQNLTMPETTSTATIGYCQLECSNFWVYMILFSVFVFIHSTGEVGSMLLILRCVDPRDKAMALGLIQFAIGLFGNVPCPIVYGAVVDSACLVWEYACGERGACWLYDSNVFRMFYHGTTGGILVMAFIVDIVVWYKAGSISFVEEQECEDGTAEEMATLKSQDAQNVDNDYL